MRWFSRRKKASSSTVKVWVIFPHRKDDGKSVWVTVDVPARSWEAAVYYRKGVAEELFGRQSVTREGQYITVSGPGVEKNPEKAAAAFLRAIG